MFHRSGFAKLESRKEIGQEDQKKLEEKWHKAMKKGDAITAASLDYNLEYILEKLNDIQNKKLTTAEKVNPFTTLRDVVQERFIKIVDVANRLSEYAKNNSLPPEAQKKIAEILDKVKSPPKDSKKMTPFITAYMEIAESRDSDADKYFRRFSEGRKLIESILTPLKRSEPKPVTEAIESKGDSKAEVPSSSRRPS